jgi:hypothetical protein
MRKTILAVLAVGITGALGCGGSSTSQQPLQHPALDQDYAGRFEGVWTGTFSITADGQTQTTTGAQPIVRTGFNTLSISDMCQAISGKAGLDSPSTFSTARSTGRRAGPDRAGAASQGEPRSVRDPEGAEAPAPAVCASGARAPVGALDSWRRRAAVLLQLIGHLGYAGIGTDLVLFAAGGT